MAQQANPPSIALASCKVISSSPNCFTSDPAPWHRTLCPRTHMRDPEAAGYGLAQLQPLWPLPSEPLNGRSLYYCSSLSLSNPTLQIHFKNQNSATLILKCQSGSQCFLLVFVYGIFIYLKGCTIDIHGFTPHVTSNSWD